jgi:ankyrin repeat protein
MLIHREAETDSIHGWRWAIGGTVALAVIVFVSVGSTVRKHFLERALIEEMHAASSINRLPDRGNILRLVRSGASPNVNTLWAWTPLDFAVKQNDLGLIRELLERGANPNQRVTGGAAIFHVRSVAAAELLISHGAQMDVGIKDDSFALVFASGNGSLEALRPLLKRGFDLDTPSSKCETALMRVAQEGREKRAQIFLSMGSDPARRDKSGNTARDYVLGRLVRVTGPTLRSRLCRLATLLEAAERKRELETCG